jgi:hypothetical protein
MNIEPVRPFETPSGIARVATERPDAKKPIWTRGPYRPQIVPAWEKLAGGVASHQPLVIALSVAAPTRYGNFAAHEQVNENDRVIVFA